MKIEKPIFIIGTGRSGSTIFYEIFSHHPNISWPSGALDKFPKKIWINRFLLHIDTFPIDKLLRKLFKPVEAYNFWESYIKGFSTPCRDLIKEDVTNETRSSIHNVLSKNLTGKRNRLAMKITGWPRIGFLKEIFPDAKFIHILRDGRAFANSLLSIKWWLGWRGPENWRWGELEEKYKKEWESYEKSFVILAAIEWKILMDSHQKASKSLTDSEYMEIKYEDFVDNPIRIYKQTTEFCELKWTTKFENSIKKFSLHNSNYKWRQNLTDKQQLDINKCLDEYLKRFGYH